MRKHNNFSCQNSTCGPCLCPKLSWSGGFSQSRWAVLPQVQVYQQYHHFPSCWSDVLPFGGWLSCLCASFVPTLSSCLSSLSFLSSCVFFISDLKLSSPSKGSGWILSFMDFTGGSGLSGVTGRNTGTGSCGRDSLGKRRRVCKIWSWEREAVLPNLNQTNMQLCLGRLIFTG